MSSQALLSHTGSISVGSAPRAISRSHAPTSRPPAKSSSRISVSWKKRRQVMTLPPSCSSQKVASAATKPPSPAPTAAPTPPCCCEDSTLPYKNTTVSLPSRATATITSTSRPHQWPLSTCCAAPACNSCLRPRPCRRIHTTICTTSALAASAITA